jgi:TctA family transporter
VWLTVFFGALGYVFNKLGCESAPLILGFILGPMLEENFRRALLLSRGDLTVFFTSPISCGLLIAAGLLLVIVLAPSIRSGREKAFHED